MVEKQSSEIIQIFLTIATILFGVLSLLSAFSIYEKRTTEDKLEQILRKLSLIPYMYKAESITTFWLQVTEINAELNQYNYTYSDFKKLINRINKSNNYCKIVMVGIFFFILISAFVLVEHSEYLLSFKIFMYITLTIFFAVCYWFPACEFINHLVPVNDAYKNKYPSTESILDINYVLKRTSPDILPELPFTLFAKSTYFEIYDIDDESMPRRFLNIKKVIRNQESGHSLALFMLPLDFKLNGINISFNYEQKLIAFHLDNTMKNDIKNDSNALIFELPFTFKNLDDIVITVRLKDECYLVYSKENSKTKNTLLPFYYSMPQNNTPEETSYNITYCTEQKNEV